MTLKNDFEDQIFDCYFWPFIRSHPKLTPFLWSVLSGLQSEMFFLINSVVLAKKILLVKLRQFGLEFSHPRLTPILWSVQSGLQSKTFFFFIKFRCHGKKHTIGYKAAIWIGIFISSITKFIIIKLCVITQVIGGNVIQLGHSFIIFDP